MLPSLGKNPSGKERKLIQQSPNYQKGAFQNLVPTAMLAENASFTKVMFRFLNKPANCFPPKPLPSVKTNLKELNSEKPVIVWFGHSSYLIKINNKTILVDPVFSGYAAPFRGMNKAFAGTNVFSADDFPTIDVLLITHDHYDHLDFTTVKKLRKKVKLVCTSLGVASHLEYWRYNKNRIQELDWHETHSLPDGMKLTALPARHFSGRGLKRNQTLWSSFVLEAGDYKLYLGGDSGYGNHFKEIGEKYGPFDVALLECGQYNLAWQDIHMMPEEVVQAAIDIKANVFMPVHWAKFSISLHPWDEPIKRVSAKAKELHVNITTPLIGEPVIINQHYPNSKWWEI